MRRAATQLYAISYDPMDEWEGVFFTKADKAAQMLEVMQQQSIDDDDLDHTALHLEVVTVRHPETPEELVQLLNAGPASIILSRKTIDIAYINRGSGF
jgi:hypothetical protein